MTMDSIMQDVYVDQDGFTPRRPGDEDDYDDTPMVKLPRHEVARSLADRYVLLPEELHCATCGYSYDKHYFWGTGKKPAGVCDGFVRGLDAIAFDLVARGPVRIVVERKNSAGRPQPERATYVTYRPWEGPMEDLSALDGLIETCVCTCHHCREHPLHDRHTRSIHPEENGQEMLFALGWNPDPDNDDPESDPF